MGLFESPGEPIFLRESSNAEEQLERLKELEKRLNDEGRKLIKQDIKNLEYGILGERNIAFELRNSHMPMYVLHDINLQYEGLEAQIDYLIFTRKVCFVVECKNLYGDVEVTSGGEFRRITEFDGKKRVESIYSPITQNQRHLELLKKIRIDRNSNFITKFIANRYFEDVYIPIVVLANSKTVLNNKSDDKTVRERVMRADQLVRFIKDTYLKSKEPVDSDKGVMERAQYYLSLHKDVERDYTKKYEKYMVEDNKGSDCEEDSVEDSEVYKELLEYRKRKSKEDKTKAYYIFKNEHLIELLNKMPKNEEELREISGFGSAKVQKYGKDVLEILMKFR